MLGVSSFGILLQRKADHFGVEITTQCCVFRPGALMVPVKSRNDFSRPMVKKRIVD